MKALRVIFFLLLIFGILGVSLILIQERSQPPFSRSFSPLFQELGKPVKSIDRAISGVLPIDKIDEKMLGCEIKLRLAETAKPADEATVRYLNSLITSLSDGKSLEYQVFVIDGPPNAFALPGGALCVTKELIGILENEAELAAVLGHEMGHVERGHLFDAARGEMLRRKVRKISIATYALDAIRLIMGLSFSKTQEDEADEYSFRMLLKKGYDPLAMSTSIEKLISGLIHKQSHTNLFEDFFGTHPHAELRIEKFRSKASLWKQNHPNEKSYLGKRNFLNKMIAAEVEFNDEWNEN